MRLKKQGIGNFYAKVIKEQGIDIIGKNYFGNVSTFLVAYSFVMWIAGNVDGIVAKHRFEIECLAHFMFQYSLRRLEKLSDTMAWGWKSGFSPYEL